MSKKTSRPKKRSTKKVHKSKSRAARNAKKQKSSKRRAAAVRGNLKPVKLLAKLEGFLKKNNAKYNARAHRTVFTAYDAAQTLKVDLRSVVKTLVVQADRNLVLVALPSNRNLDFGKLRKTLKSAGQPVKKISLASEKLISSRITKTPGAVPPFGGLYRIPTVADRGVLKPRTLILN